MGLELRYPKITGITEKEQLAQVKSYLHQLVEQLQWALNNVTSSNASSYVVSQTPKSVSHATSSSFDKEVAFDALKPLIIKSADIVEAYYEEISTRLEGLYVAQSDFGTYTEETEQTITANSTDIEQTFANIQQILTDIENINFTLAETNAHIKSGILYYDEDGLPVYGVEIGQKNTIDGEEVFNKYARYTAGRLSFYDQNDSEVAYISNYKLYITHVEIIESLSGGGFRLYFTKGIRLKWVGRG